MASGCLGEGNLEITFAVFKFCTISMCYLFTKDIVGSFWFSQTIVRKPN